ncbi:MAG TPA: hypothetical protein VIK78_22525 [Ruminiclostridium sp.]
MLEIAICDDDIADLSNMVSIVNEYNSLQMDLNIQHLIVLWT